MEKYLVIIKLFSAYRYSSFIFNIFDEDTLRKQVINPKNSGKTLLISGQVIRPEDIEVLRIVRADPKDPERLTQIALRTTYGELYRKDIFARADVNDLFQKKEFDENSSCIIRKKEIVFIVHGRMKEPALELQKHLKSKNVDAIIFDDLKEENTSNTIIELLEYIKDNVAYAFVIATPDDIGCLYADYSSCEREILLNGTVSAKDLKTIEGQLSYRSRQNVVFEHGLFMGAIGRDRVCCLLHKKTVDKPSDIDGILYLPFEKSIKEVFNEVNKKLKDSKIGLIKA